MLLVLPRRALLLGVCVPGAEAVASWLGSRPVLHQEVLRPEGRQGEVLREAEA